MADPWVRWREVFGSETEYIIKLWSCFSDPKEKEEFLNTIRERKKANPRWSIYDDFPKTKRQVSKEKTELERAREEFKQWCEARWGKRDGA